MQYAFGSTDSSCAEVQGDALPRRADLQNRQALPWIEPCSGLNTFPFIRPLRPSFICPFCPSCPFSKSFFFAIIRHRASVYADLVVVLCVCTLMSCMIAQESNKNCGAGWLSSQKSIFQMWECYYDGDILLHFKISYFNLESDFWCLNLICPTTAVAHQSNIHLKEPSYS